MLLVFGGICTALSVIALCLSTYIHINTLAFLALASALTGVMQIEGGTRYSLLTFGATSFLLLILPVDRLSFIYYIGFFGYYPVLKFYIERLDSLKWELIIKTVFFVLISFLGLWIITGFLAKSISESLPWQLIALFGVLLMHVFDYALSVFFSVYEKKIRNKIKR
ncbi:MAG: hypothetical protein E7411_06700 [Ruminococcaceae bacterium]|nr:hypothetical protein [Oscillospiraceae bacterium]